MPLARRSGHRQRWLATVAARTESELARYLEEMFAFGLMSAMMVQVIAAKAVSDHENSPEDLKALASLGAHGTHRSNCHRDLIHLLQNQIDIVPSPMPVNIPMKNLKKRTIDGAVVVEQATSMIAPQEVFSTLYHKKPGAFARRFLGTDSVDNAGDTLAAFWDSVPEHDPRKGALRRAWAERGEGAEDLLWRRAVPLALHADAVPIGNKASLDTVSWSGMLGQGLSTLEHKIFCSSLVTKLAAPSTAEAFWSKIMWCFLMLWLGIFPLFDSDGADWPPRSERLRNAGHLLAAGLFGVVWTIKGDMDEIANSLDLNHSSSLFPCPWCDCNKFRTGLEVMAQTFNIPPRPWYDYSARAAWRSTVWRDTNQWADSRDKLNPIFLLPYLSICFVMADVLHIVDLGFTHHLLGNTFYHVCYCTGNRFGRSVEDRLDYLWERISQQYRGRSTPCQLHNLTLSMFVDPSRPHLSHPVLTTRVKAAESRQLVPCVADIWRDLQDGSDFEAHMLRTLDSLAAFYDILNENAHSYTLPNDKLIGLQGHVKTCLIHYNALSDLSRSAGRGMAWHQVPKFHFWEHVAEQASVQNPVWSWCYVDEDFMRIVKDIATSCTAATALPKVAGKVAEKWRLGWGLRLSRE